MKDRSIIFPINNMRANRKTVEAIIQNFIENPSTTLELDVCWVKQASKDCPRHLIDEESVFICGTNYLNEEYSEGDYIAIALTDIHRKNVQTYSVNYMFGEYAQFVLCKKCLAWLRKQLQPLKSATAADFNSSAALKDDSFLERLG